MIDRSGPGATDAPATSSPGTGEEVVGPRRRLARIAIWAVVAMMAGIWGYVLYLSFGPGRSEPMDYLSDRAFVAEAAAVCARASAVLETQPVASELRSLEERAAALDEATDVLDELVRDLRSIPHPAGEEGRAVARWLDDWEQYNLDRREYADRFREGLDEPFRVTDRGGFQINVLIDQFAVGNDMDDCATPLDA